MRPSTLPLLIVSFCCFSCHFGGRLAESDIHTTVIIDADSVVATDGHSGKLFDILTAKSTGLNFINTIPDDYENNYWRYVFVYNGGSVNISDFNNDGLPDLFFTGVMVPHGLFLNKGNLQFEDITPTSGISKQKGEWTSGSTVADVNGDGWMDIYITNSRMDDPQLRKNKLYINQHNGTFTEEAEKYGLADPVTCSAANFFDYDNDGDLDMYLVTHPMDFINKFKTVYFQKIERGENLSDKLYRNNGDGTFTDVHVQAGINNHGFGLSCSTADIDGNGFQDIYVANDFGMYDFLYLNNGDGTFTDVSLTNILHHDVSSMGTDIADYNNDTYPDIFNADIELQNNYSYKTFQVSSQIEVVRILSNAGYGYQKHGNSLKLNNGDGTFREAGRTAGVAVTDWAWSGFFGDFDNDSYKDLFISTGYLQDFNIDETETYNKLRRACRISDSTVYYTLINSMPRHVLNQPNYIYKNNGDLTFTNMQHQWGIYYPSVSYGAACADLDKDGDLDMVCANANDHPFVYRNNAASAKNPAHYLRIQPVGYASNTKGNGTKVTLYYQGKKQYEQHSNTRGFISTTEDVMHFGLGATTLVDSVIIEWLDGKQQLLRNVAADQEIIADHADAIAADYYPKVTYQPLFTQITDASGLQYTHAENDFDDYLREFILPHKMSIGGPCIAAADVDGNGLEDVYIGGSLGKAGCLYLQKKEGQFIAGNFIPYAKGTHEDGGAVFFDADGDHDADLFLSGGGNEKAAGDGMYRDLFFLNDGKGNFEPAQHLIPEIKMPKSCAVPIDYDDDGDLDLFVGGRQYPGRYMAFVSSYIFRNDSGKFTDVSATIAPFLKDIGMVTDATVADINGDNKTELLITGDWMGVVVCTYTNNSFKRIDNGLMPDQLNGWWQSMCTADLDADGDQDIVLGNFGTNRRYVAERSSITGKLLPLEGYADDFDGNGTYDAVLAYYQKDKLYPIQLRERLLEQIPGIRDRIPTWDSYGKATMQDIFQEALPKAHHVQAYQFESMVLRNDNGKFTMLPLPVDAQLSVIMDMVITDVNADAIPDIICQGNLYQTDILIMRHDASIGNVLIGKGDGTFTALPWYASGFRTEGDTRGLVMINNSSKPILISTCNSGKVKVFRAINDLSRERVTAGR